MRFLARQVRLAGRERTSRPVADELAASWSHPRAPNGCRDATWRRRFCEGRLALPFDAIEEIEGGDERGVALQFFEGRFKGVESTLDSAHAIERGAKIGHAPQPRLQAIELFGIEACKVLTRRLAWKQIRQSIHPRHDPRLWRRTCATLGPARLRSCRSRRAACPSRRRNRRRAGSAPDIPREPRPAHR